MGIAVMKQRTVHLMSLHRSSEARCTVLGFIVAMPMCPEHLEISPRLIYTKVNLINFKNGGTDRFLIGTFEMLNFICLMTCMWFSGPKHSDRLPSSNSTVRYGYMYQFVFLYPAFRKRCSSTRDASFFLLICRFK